MAVESVRILANRRRLFFRMSLAYFLKPEVKCLDSVDRSVVVSELTKDLKNRIKLKKIGQSLFIYDLKSWLKFGTEA